MKSWKNMFKLGGTEQAPSEIPSITPEFWGCLSEENFNILQKFYEESHLLLPETLFRNIHNITLNFEKQTYEEFTPFHAFLLRFLRARRFNCQESLSMLKKFLEWRTLHKLDIICYEVQYPWVDVLQSLYPHGYYGLDNEGRPVGINRLGIINVKEVLKVAPLNYLFAFWIFQYEYLIQVVLPACSILAQKPIEQTLSIVDLKEIGLSSFKEESRNLLRKIIFIGQDSYPEIMKKMFILNTPAVFQFIWSIVKGMLDEGTVNKIEVLTGRDDEWKTAVSKYVSLDNIPQSMGGNGPENFWKGKPTDPWNNEEILEKIKSANPQISDNILYRKVECSDDSLLKLLDDIKED